VVRCLIGFIFFVITDCFSQKVYDKSATITFEPYNSIIIDGQLRFEIDVRMSDCLENIEILDIDKIKIKKNIWDKIHDWWWFKIRRNFDFKISKRFTLELNEDNYHLREDESDEQIYMKCDILTLKSIFERKTLKKKLQINLYSKSGKKVYSKIFILDKLKLIENGEVRIGIEPI
jgi:hypothetical protein